MSAEDESTESTETLDSQGDSEVTLAVTNGNVDQVKDKIGQDQNPVNLDGQEAAALDQTLVDEGGAEISQSEIFEETINSSRDQSEGQTTEEQTGTENAP